MRTKALLLAAALVAGGALTGAAQTVYSVNAVGYVNLAIPAGWSMIANPLQTTNNSLSSILTSAPDGSSIYMWNGTEFVIATAVGGMWFSSAGDVKLEPGQGCFINSVAAFTNTFVGEVMQGTGVNQLTNPIPAGFSMRASQVPQEADTQALSLDDNLAAGDTIYKWNTSTQQYDIYTFIAPGMWGSAFGITPPTIKVGESFWLNAAGATTWNREFTVNTP